jgi:hypothetical protein
VKVRRVLIVAVLSANELEGLARAHGTGQPRAFAERSLTLDPA